MLGAGQHPDVGFPRPFPSVSICEICVICGYSTFPFVDWPRSLSVYASCWYSPLAFACFSCKCGGSVRGNQAELKGLKESAGNLEGRIDGAARYFPLDRWGLRSQCGFADRQFTCISGCPTYEVVVFRHRLVYLYSYTHSIDDLGRSSFLIIK